MSLTAEARMKNTPTKSVEIGGDLLLPAHILLERYDIAGRTLDRWLHRADLRFPRPFVINKRRYFKLHEIENWERARAAAMEAA
jgi:hypothetical protein